MVKQTEHRNLFVVWYWLSGELHRDVAYSAEHAVSILAASARVFYRPWLETLKQ